MSLFYFASRKELGQLRNKIFLERGIPALQKKGFKKSPFLNVDFGWHPGIGYLYELCCISEGGFLEIVNVHIVRGDRWIQVWLNIFELSPALTSLDQLAGLDGMQFNLPPNTRTQMRLRSDGIKGILLSYELIAARHRLNRYFTKWGRERSAKKLGDRIEKDLLNIDNFISRWRELHKPMVTNWEGKTL